MGRRFCQDLVSCRATTQYSRRPRIDAFSTQCLLPDSSRNRGRHHFVKNDRSPCIRATPIDRDLSLPLQYWRKKCYCCTWVSGMRPVSHARPKTADGGDNIPTKHSAQLKENNSNMPPVCDVASKQTLRVPPPCLKAARRAHTRYWLAFTRAAMPDRQNSRRYLHDRGQEKHRRVEGVRPERTVRHDGRVLRVGMALAQPRHRHQRGQVGGELPQHGQAGREAQDSRRRPRRRQAP